VVITTVEWNKDHITE